MPAAIAHRQISDNAQAASEEINYTLINTGTWPSGWYSPWASAGTYVAHEQTNQLSGGSTWRFNQSPPLVIILNQSVPSISHLDNLFREDQYIFLSPHFLSFEWLLCRDSPLNLSNYSVCSAFYEEAKSVVKVSNVTSRKLILWWAQFCKNDTLKHWTTPIALPMTQNTWFFKDLC
jgi:hypothetical protein